MIEGIDAKLKVLLAEKAQSAEKEAEAPAEPCLNILWMLIQKRIE